MFSIYKQAMKKYFKSPSTWIILVAGVFLSGFMGGVMPWINFDANKEMATSSYILLVVGTIGVISTFVSIFASIYAGFKGAAMFRDEIEAGTFLTLLSKPIRRSGIIFGKWLALQSALLVFSFLVAFAFGVSSAIFDKGSQLSNLELFGTTTLRQNAALVSVYLWGIFMLMSIIFSSFALLISTRLSFGATIGLTIATGVIIPITSLVFTFTYKKSHDKISDGKALSVIFDFEKEARSLGAKDSELNLPERYAQDKKHYFDLMMDTNSIYSLGVATGETNGFKDAWYMDINYQISQLASFASESFVSKRTELAAADSNARAQFMTSALIPDETHELSQTKNHAFNYLKDGLKRTLSVYKNIAPYLIERYWAILNRIKDDESSALQTNFNKQEILVPRSLAKRLINSFLITTSSSVSGTTITGITHVDVSRSSTTKENASANKWSTPWYAVAEELNANNTIHSSYKVKASTLWPALDTMFNFEKYGREFGKTSGDEYSFDEKGKIITSGYATGKYAKRAASDVTDYFLKSRESMTALIYRSKMTNFASLYSDLLLKVHRLINPLYALWFDIGKIRKMNSRGIEKNGAEYSKTYYHFDGKHSTHDSADNLQSLDMNGFQMSSSDLDVANYLLKAAEVHPELFVKLTAKGYSNNFTILWVYLGIALGLVPISFIVLRFQDFK